MYAKQTQKQSLRTRFAAFVALTRLHRPVGIWLLLWPCWWAVGLASPGAPDASVLLWFLLGAACMRSAGCILNDMADRRIDAQVARTRTRPLASGALTLADAVALLAFLLSLALLILLQLEPALLPYAAASLLLVAAYPLMKRVTWWPQAFLGLTFNIGALFGWVAVTGALHEAALALYFAGLAWTLGYDTIYAHQDIEDDLKIGVKSTAIRFGAHNRAALCLIYATTALSMALAVWLAEAGLVAWLGWSGFAAHLCWQIIRFHPHDPPIALRLFTANQWAGGILAASFLLDGWLI